MLLGRKPFLCNALEKQIVGPYCKTRSAHGTNQSSPFRRGLICYSMNDASYNIAKISKIHWSIKLNRIPANSNFVSAASVEHQSIWSSNLNIIINAYCSQVLFNKFLLKVHCLFIFLLLQEEKYKWLQLFITLHSDLRYRDEYKV